VSRCWTHPGRVLAYRHDPRFGAVAYVIEPAWGVAVSASCSPDAQRRDVWHPSPGPAFAHADREADLTL
jgi:hypothetical protein